MIAENPESEMLLPWVYIYIYMYVYISSKLILVTLRDLLCKNVFLFWKGPLNIGMGYVIDLFFGFF